MRTLKQIMFLLCGVLVWLTSTAAQSTPALADGARVAAEPKPSSGSGTDGTELRLNFRGASLDAVLQYLSDAAGFIIDLQTNLKGKVDVWSRQPVSQDEALALVNSALDNNGYTAVRNGRILTIYNKEEARKRNLPVKSGNRPEDIPRNDEMVTQIIPVRFISAVQIARNLQAIVPDKATITANEGGNALVITDTQVSIHRMAEIIKALDTALASVSSIRVFSLKFADAKAVAGVLKDLFQPQETSQANNQNQGQGQVVNTFQTDDSGGPGLGGEGFGQGGVGQPRGGRSGGTSMGGRAPATKVMSVAEERSNSVLVNAPEDQMPIIASIIRQVDTNIQDVTELRVFRLKNADAQETADLLLNLFSDTGSNNQSSGAQVQFGGPFGAGFGSGAADASTDQSPRFQRQAKVAAVAEPRTGSVVVSAGHELIRQIAGMITELDADASRKQHVFVYSAQHSDAQSIMNILESLVPPPTSANSSSLGTMPLRN